MNITTIHYPRTTDSPVLSVQNQGYENIRFEQLQCGAQKEWQQYRDEHIICLCLAPRPFHLLQIRGTQTRTGMYGRGDISITPAEVPFFSRSEGDNQHLRIRIASQFLQTVAKEALEINPDRVELLTEFRVRDPQIEAIGMMLLAELQQENLGGKLYIESLSNVLVVHLLRQYTTDKPHLPVYQGGLPQRQLLQVLDYMNDHLNQEIQLADLAQLLEMSQFHFSRLFKQSIGMAPYQYLLQQRVERAKQLLKQTDHSIVDIALRCGFSSHSHFSQQFRQFTGVTPKVYRTASVTASGS